MKTLIIALLIMVSMVSAQTRGVVYDSDYQRDAQQVYDMVSIMGYPNCRVGIYWSEGAYSYFVFFPTTTRGSMSQFLAAVISVGRISAGTSWSSRYVHVGFTDAMYSVRTSVARNITLNFETQTPEYWIVYLERNTEYIRDPY